jgi:ATP-dependent Lhr-like helicase
MSGTAAPALGHGPAGAQGFGTFHPLVREWFEANVGTPTAVQAEAWRRIQSGEHVLAMAPTGSGKTLAAFLHAISLLVSGSLPSEGLSVLYVSPLKALNEDLRRNLELPLAGIARLFAERGAPCPEIRVETRSGDTPQSQRRRFLSKPPAILCTTPESLAILLDSPRARPVLAGIRLVVLDEIHAVAGSKRGSILASSVARLALLAGEFQRVALSATLKPAEEVARFVGGVILDRDAEGRAAYRERSVAIVSPPQEKAIEFRVLWPKTGVSAGKAAGAATGATPAGAEAESRYDAIIPAIAARLPEVRSLLVFTDSRRRAERMAFLLNEAVGPGTAWAHHGSLAREARLVVEERFKAGELKCVVATASLELGIDIGSVDEVILAGAPPEVSSALQRAGRSGHGVGHVSRATVYPFHGMDLLLAAAVVEGAEARDVEALRIPRAPLDILAQQVLALAAERERHCDELFDVIRSFPPFERLARSLFDSILDMLAGRYAVRGPGGTSRIRELEPRVYFDRATGMVRARDSARFLLLSSGGAIADRGHYSMRIAGSKTRIGELDEEFVYERKVGDAFSMGTQSWKIVDIGPEAVEVAPLGHGADFIPFWKAEGRFRSPVVTDRLLGLLDRFAATGPSRGSGHVLDREAVEAILEGEYRFEPQAARVAAAFVSAQEAAAGRLPGRCAISVEAYADPARRGEAHCVVIHTLRGGGINEPLGLALAAAFEEAGRLAPEVISDDNFVLVILPGGTGEGSASSCEGGAASVDGPEAAATTVMGLLRGMVPHSRVEALVRRRLEGSGLFGAEFRENAGRALLIPRGGMGKRNPLWVTRLRAKRLFDAVSGYPDFPITAETWRSCLVDLFDMDGLSELLEGVASSRIGLSSFVSRVPSPFAREAIWKETGEYMYRGDELARRPASSVSDNVIKAAVASSRLRPRLDPGLIADFAEKAKRLVPGWGPADPFELAEWAKERVLIPADELGDLVAAGGMGLAAALDADPGVGGRLKTVTLAGASQPAIVHAERLEELRAEPAAFIAEWLRREGPVAPERLRALFGLGEDELSALLDGLGDEGVVVVDEFRKEGGGTEVIDAENLEILLRLARKAARPELSARPAGDLFRLVARLQRLDPRGPAASAPPAMPAANALPDIAAVLEALAGCCLPVGLWEGEVLGCRLSPYDPRSLDYELASGRRLWFGSGREQVAFCGAEELELFGSGAASALVPEDRATCDFWSIKSSLGKDSKATALALWAEAWKGSLSSASFEPLRLGMRNRFGHDLPELETGGGAGELRDNATRERRIPRALRERWRGGAPVSGEWFSLGLPPAESDALDQEELSSARVRILLRRYGVLSRDILERELPPLRWGAIFPALRRMELSGELLYGRFFEGLDGPQFMSPEAFELFKGLDGLPPPAPLWLNALDPAAAALALASGPGAAGPRFPARIAANRLGVAGGRLVAVLSRSGASLETADDLDEAGASALFGRLPDLRARIGQKIRIAAIDGGPATASRWTPFLAGAGFEPDRGSLVLW